MQAPADGCDSLQQDVERAAEAAALFGGARTGRSAVPASMQAVVLERRRRFAAHGFTRRTVETLELLEETHRAR